MGKRSEFERRPQDAYDTPLKAVLPLLPHLPAGTRFIEPCAGKGDLVGHLTGKGHICEVAFDIEPRADTIIKRDALTFNAANHYYDFDMFITNPPWTREILHPLILHLFWQRPTWLLFDADWAHTVQAAPYLPLCKKIVSVGRIKWIEGSPHQGKDNCAWHLFHASQKIEFFGRQ